MLTRDTLVYIDDDELGPTVFPFGSLLKAQKAYRILADENPMLAVDLYYAMRYTDSLIDAVFDQYTVESS
jgi:hypothetical protein